MNLTIRESFSRAIPPEERRSPVEEKQRIAVMTIFAILASAVALIVGPGTYAKFGGLIGQLPFIYAGISALLIVLYHVFRLRIPFIELSVLAAGIIIVYGVCLGGVDQAGHLWSFVYIPVTAYALGLRKALWIHGSLFVFFCFVMFIPYNPFLLADYSVGFKLRFILAFFLASVTTYLIEAALIRSKYAQALLLTQLEELNEKKNEFIGIVAHDLRNPLAIISGHAELIALALKANKSSPDRVLEDLEKITSVSLNMSKTLNELLDISAIESGKMHMDFEMGDLRKVVDACVPLHRRNAEIKNIHLTIDDGNGLPPVKMDTLKIASVIDNLLSNAVKYTHSHGRVEIFFENRDTEVVTLVRDTGQGLSPADMEKVFTTFKRLSARPTAGEPSTGLGLAITKRIVEHHGGRVWVDSRLGQGSTFGFSIPKSPASG